MALIVNVSKVLLGNVFNKLYPFLILNLVAITVDAEAVGGYALFISISGVAAIFITGGIGPILVRYLAAPAEIDCISKKAVIDFSLFLSVAAILVSSVAICFFVLDVLSIMIPGVEPVLFFVLIVVYLIGQSIVSVAKNVLLGLRKYGTSMIYEFVMTAINLGGLAVVFLYYGLSSLKVYLCLSALLSVANGVISVFLILHARGNIYEKNWAKLSCVQIRRLLSFGAPSLVNAIMFTPVLLAGKFLLEHYHGLAAVGHFELAFQWATMVLIVTGVVSSLTLPELAANLNDYPRLKSTYFQCLTINFLASLFLGCLLIFLFFLSRFVESDLLSFAHQVDGRVLVLALITAIFISIWSVQTKIFAAFDKQFFVASLNLVWALVCGAVTIVFVPQYGVLGLMGSVVIGWFVLVLVFAWFNHRFMREKDAIPFV